KSVGAVLEKGLVKGISHITGGGFYENFPRVMPDGLGVNIDESTWEVPEVFRFLQKTASMTNEEMYGVFNMGIGMALIVNKEDADEVITILEDVGENAMEIGQVINKEGVHF